MDFSMKDIALITTMSGAIIFMSFTFPALGMADDGNQTSASDIPEFNISSGEFDIVGDFPEQPGTPTSGTLTFDASRDDPNQIDGVTQVTLDQRDANDPDDDAFLIGIQNDTDEFYAFTLFTEGGDPVGTYVDRVEITNEGQEIFIENNSWNMRFEVDSLENYRQPNMTASVDWEVLGAPDEATGGGIFAPVSDVVGMLAYLGDIIFWGIGFIFEISLTIVTILIEVMIFGVSLMQWLLTTYFAIVAAAGSWAGPVLMIPAVLLFFEFAKIAMLGIKLLPTT